jgi:hypothetical protein
VNTEKNGSDLIGIAKVAGLATVAEEEADRLSAWLEAYFALEASSTVPPAVSPRK